MSDQLGAVGGLVDRYHSVDLWSLDKASSRKSDTHGGNPSHNPGNFNLQECLNRGLRQIACHTQPSSNSHASRLKRVYPK
jgi:hypothetical protein